MLSFFNPLSLKFSVLYKMMGRNGLTFVSSYLPTQSVNNSSKNSTVPSGRLLNKHVEWPTMT